MRTSHTANTRLDFERTRGWSVGRRITEAEAESRKFFEHGDNDDCCRRNKQGQAESRMRDRKGSLVMVAYASVAASFTFCPVLTPRWSYLCFSLRQVLGVRDLGKMHSTTSVVDETYDPRDPLKPVEMENINGTKLKGTDAKTCYPKEVSVPKRDTLHVIDDRTGKYYVLPIIHNAINASEFKQINAPDDTHSYADQTENGIRIYDPGFSNTAVSTSNITYV